MFASIIIPTYNACERLKLNLFSLNLQNCPRNQFEVIVIENGSTDESRSLLKSFNANFDLSTIFLDKNMGRSYARNLGIIKAKGDLLIFHDSDMIADTGFAWSHIQYHERTPGAVICGPGWRRIYTYYYKAFKKKTRENFLRQKHLYKIQKKDYYLADKYQLLNESDIEKSSILHYSFLLEIEEKKLSNILERYGSELSGYCFPWRFFMTNNCSVEKDAVLRAGMFDESFIGWGCEDLDLGYRLFQKGYRFVRENKVVSLHQEHPINYADTSGNIYRFTKKYDTLDLLLFYYGRDTCTDELSLNKVMVDLQEMMKIKKYEELLSIYKESLMLVRESCINHATLQKSAEAKYARQVVEKMKKQLEITELRRHYTYAYAAINKLAGFIPTKSGS